ncbi:hypothetical protein GOZ90_24450 [Agrobacterium vitis]|uniref:Uncharacterized protein n=1 Tax=Agrobacterium vitis TaxID=373 RepID=A0A6L6VL49_AGRVI|nr:antitoxin VbhA family protein [Agrobacterium vitis]MUZ75821.1 hypothetical protein [Agrobacterium vitis]MVA19911.1 hypothetical protein [Agrobacterium vitis]
MNIRQTVPDRSPEAIARRRRATDEARAAIARQGYKHDPVLEAATEAYVNGDITREQYRSQMVRAPQQA